MIYGYIRVSHEHSTQSNLSPANQRDAIKAMAATLDGSFGEDRYPSDDPDPGIFSDLSTSAWKIPFVRRHGASALLKVVQPGDHVIFYSIDRGFRSTKDFLETTDALIKRGIYVHSIREQFNTATANGRLLATVIAAFAEWQSHVKSERQKEANAVRKQKEQGVKATPTSRAHLKPIRNAAIFPEKPSTDPIADRTGTIYTYSRRSVVEKDEHASLVAQREITTRPIPLILARHPKMVQGQHFEDAGVSAYTVNLHERPAGAELCSILKPGDIVVVARLDRAWRRMSDMVQTIMDWDARGIGIHFCDTGIDTQSPTGRFFIQMMASFAELESSVKSMVIKEALARLRMMGCALGGDMPRHGTKNKEAYSLDGKIRKHIVWDHESLKRAKLWWYLNRKRGMSARGVRDFYERCMAKRDGRKFIPSHGGWIKGKPVNVIWNYMYVWFYIQEYDKMFHRIMAKIRKNRRSNRAKRLRNYRKRGPVGANGELRLPIKREVKSKKDLIQAGVKWIDAAKHERKRRRTNHTRLLRQRRERGSDPSPDHPLSSQPTRRRRSSHRDLGQAGPDRT